MVFNTNIFKNYRLFKNYRFFIFLLTIIILVFMFFLPSCSQLAGFKDKMVRFLNKEREAENAVEVVKSFFDALIQNDLEKAFTHVYIYKDVIIPEINIPEISFSNSNKNNQNDLGLLYDNNDKDKTNINSLITDDIDSSKENIQSPGNESKTKTNALEKYYDKLFVQKKKENLNNLSNSKDSEAIRTNINIKTNENKDKEEILVYTFEDFKNELKNVTDITKVEINWVKVKNNIAIVGIDLYDTYDGEEKIFKELIVSLLKDSNNEWKINFWHQ